MEKVFFCGQMEESIKDNIKMIKNMDMVFFFGQIKGNIKDIGKMENRMGQELFIQNKDQ